MAKPVRMALVGERISLRVKTTIFRIFAMLPNMQTAQLRYPCIKLYLKRKYNTIFKWISDFFISENVDKRSNLMKICLSHIDICIIYEQCTHTGTHIHSWCNIDDRLIFVLHYIHSSRSRSGEEWRKWLIFDHCMCSFLRHPSPSLLVVPMAWIYVM